MRRTNRGGKTSEDEVKDPLKWVRMILFRRGLRRIEYFFEKLEPNTHSNGFRNVLKRGVSWGSGVGDYVSDVLHSGHVHDETLKPEAESRVRH